ncbi:hypothetical protein SUGI_0087700 [Cryptomeria japonica]|nr:hypothetical protein SUGI_0087700 [Cryptomeria japonica]
MTYFIGWRACEFLRAVELGLQCPSLREVELQVGHWGEVGAGAAGVWCCRRGREGFSGGSGGCFGGLRAKCYLCVVGSWGCCGPRVFKGFGVSAGSPSRWALGGGKIVLLVVHATEWIHWITELHHHHRSYILWRLLLQNSTVVFVDISCCKCKNKVMKIAADIPGCFQLHKDGRQQAHSPSLHVAAKKLQFDKNGPKAGCSTF